METGMAVFVSVEIKPDRIDDFLVAMEQDARMSRDKTLDPGCLRFDLLRNRRDPNRFMFYECFADDAAAAIHKTTPHYKAWADFKATGGVLNQKTRKLESKSLPPWAFQGRPVERSGSPSSITITLLAVKAGRLDAFLQALHALVASARASSSGLRVDLLREKEDQHRFVLYEVFTDDEGFTKHRASEPCKAWNEFVSQGGLQEETEVVQLEASSLVGGWAFQTER